MKKEELIKNRSLKLVRLFYAVFFGGFAGSSAIAGGSGNWQETNPNVAYN